MTLVNGGVSRRANPHCSGRARPRIPMEGVCEMPMIRPLRAPIVLAALAGLGLAAQQPAQPGGAQPQTGGQTDMSSMMTQCQQHHQAMDASLDQVLTAVREARQSNDPSRMRAALDQVETSLAGMRQRVSVCTTMMNSMSNMMGMMMCPMMSAAASSTAAKGHGQTSMICCPMMSH